MADKDKDLVNQNEIEQLLSQPTPDKSAPEAAPTEPTSNGPAPGEATPETASETPDKGALDQAEIEAMLSGGAKTTAADASPADADKLLAQDDIEKLLSKAGTAKIPTTPKAAATVEQAGPPSTASTAAASDGIMAQKDVEYLFEQAQRAIESIDTPSPADAIPGIGTFRLEQFTGAPASAESATLDLIRDVDLDVQIELGRTHMYLEEVLKLRKGSVVPLDKLAGDPVDIYVNGRLIARGEVLVLNDNFCVRVAELIAGAGA